MNQSVALFVFPPFPVEHVYKVADSVTVTIRLFNFGAAADADNLTVVLNPDSVDERWAVPVRTAVGAYEVTFQIQSSDLGPSVPDGSSLLDIRVSATVGAVSDFQYATLRVGSLLEAVVRLSSITATPGGRITLAVLIREDGILRDADALYLNASRYAFPLSPSNESTPLNWTRTGTGTYAASYTIPTSIEDSTAIDFSAWAFLHGSYTMGTAYVFVPVPIRLDVWTHQPSANGTSAQVEVYAANMTGWPVVGAHVTMRYETLSFPYSVKRFELNGTTDRRGRALFNLTFEAGNFVYYWGDVTEGSGRQFYSGAVYPPYVPSVSDFAIQRGEAFRFYDVGELAVLNYTMLYHSAPRAGQVVYYYASTSERMVANGSTTTNEAGRFQLSFVMPGPIVVIEFAALVDGHWLLGTDVPAGAVALNLQREEFRVGGVTHVTATLPPGSGPWAGVVLFLPYDFNKLLSYAPPAWLPAGYYSGIGSLIVPTGSTLSYDLMIPRFLPKDSDYLFLAEAFPLNYSASFGAFVPYAHVERVHITNAPPTVVAALSSTDVPPGGNLTVNMSGSMDTDGIIDAYQVAWGDGTSTGWTEAGTARHIFDAPGDFRVTVLVRDDTGAVAETQRTVHVEGGILGMRATDFAILMAFLVAIVLVVALLVQKRRRRPPTVTPIPPAATPVMPSPTEEAGSPPKNPPGSQ